MIEHTIRCICNHPEHQVTLSYDPRDVQYAQLYLCFYLSPLSLPTRIWTAIKYIFGHRSRYGDFGEIVLDYYKVVKLQRFLAEYIIEMDKHRQKGLQQERYA